MKINKRWYSIVLLMFVLTDILFSAQFESLIQTYDMLTTIAGKGGADDGVVNEWKKSFEGNKAIDAVLSGPHFAVADSIGNVFIADKDAHAIRKVDLAGIITTVAGINAAGDGSNGKAVEMALSSPNGLWVNKSGVLYILDCGNKKVKKVDIDGIMTTALEDNSGFGSGRGLWVSRTEDTIWYSCGNVVKRWTKEGGSKICASGFEDLGNITQDKNGYIIATDRSANLVYRILNDSLKAVIAGTGAIAGGGDGVAATQTAFYGVRGVWFLEDNSYFLATHEGSQVWYVDTSGIAHVFINGKEGDKNHSGDGENFRTPGNKVSEVRAVTVDYQGNVLITENDKGYIRKVSKRNVGGIRLVRRASSGRTMQITSHPQILELNFPSVQTEKTSVFITDQAGRVFPQSRCSFKADVHGVQTVEIKTTMMKTGIYMVLVKSGDNVFKGTFCIIK